MNFRIEQHKGCVESLMTCSEKKKQLIKKHEQKRVHKLNMCILFVKSKCLDIN